MIREHNLLYSKSESGKWHTTSLCSAVFFTFTLKFYCYRLFLLMFRETLLWRVIVLSVEAGLCSYLWSSNETQLETYIQIFAVPVQSIRKRLHQN